MELIVSVIEAKNLIIPKSVYRVKNTYVFIRYAGESVRSKTDQNQTDCPIWGFTATIKNIVPEDMDITIDVYRDRMWAFTDCHIGKSIIRIPEHDQSLKSWVRISSNGRYSGDVLVNLKWKSVGSEDNMLESIEMGHKLNKKFQRSETMPVSLFPSSSSRQNYFDSYLPSRPSTSTKEIDPQLPEITQRQHKASSPHPKEDCNVVLPPSIKIYEAKDLEYCSPSIGCGFHGEVHRCLLNGNLFAVKTYHTTNSGITLFIDQVNQLHHFDSPNIVKLIGVVAKKRQIVMEYMDSGNLRDFLDKRFQEVGKDHDLNELLPIALQIAKALSYLHSKNVIHRDFKSTKILLDKNGLVKLGDFAISHNILDEMRSSIWMAPEVVKDAEYSTSADIFSLGVILTELDLLVQPFSEPTWTSSTIKCCFENGLRPSVRQGCMAWYKKLVDRCLQFEPTSRPSAAEVVNILEAHQCNKKDA